MGKVFLSLAIAIVCFSGLGYCAVQETAGSTEVTAQKVVLEEQAAGDLASDPATESDSASEPESILAGHSFHGEVFNEGPRQQALLLPGVGTVDFPVSTNNDDAQKFFNQGVAQLHGFWYFESERSFRRVSQLDPGCAMAYWGMAMSNFENEARARGFIAQAVSHRDNAGPREQQYIDALNTFFAENDKKDKNQRATKLAEDLEAIVANHPDDIEAKAFLVTQYWANLRSGGSIQSHVAVDALLQDVFDAQPDHPAHHYRIHLWDSKKPEKALASAAACGPSAPGIAHMWHMPGHIYAKLKRYSDSAWQQEASARVDHQHMMRYQVLPDQIHNFAHNNEWLVRNLINVGRVGDALALAKNMVELPHHPSYNRPGKGGSSASFGRSRLFDVVNTYELWDELIRLSDSPYLRPGDDRSEQVRHLRQVGMAEFQLGKIAEGKSRIDQLTELRAGWEQAQQEAIDAATKTATDEGKEAKEIEEAGKKAGKSEERGLKDAADAIGVLEGFALIAEGDFAGGHKKLKDAKSLDTVLRNRIQFLAGETDKAIEAARKHAGKRTNEVQPLAGLVELLWMADKRDEAIAEFEKLRAISGPIDLQAPIFVRLTEMARTLDWDDDWRLQPAAATDLGDRPDLDSLGPFRWEPSPANVFELPDASGQHHSLEDFQGRPVVVVFYLGHGCLHCVEQLKAISPMAAEFEQNGISLIAISTEGLDELKQSIEGFDGTAIPFPLVADPELEVFRKYRAYDDFEQQPLHGTFAIDGQGKIIWHDISYEPFMDIRFVLDEMLRQRELQEFQTRSNSSR